jgi:hypothetical protein
LIVTSLRELGSRARKTSPIPPAPRAEREFHRPDARARGIGMKAGLHAGWSFVCRLAGTIFRRSPW